MHFYLYSICIIACIGYAMAAGGAPERLASLVLLLGSVMTPLVVTDWSRAFLSAETGILAVDAADQVLLTLLALKADRFWPMTVAALHMLPILIHLSKLAAPAIEPRVYAIAQAFESYLFLAIIAVGTRRHQLRAKILGADRSWST